MPVAAVMPVAVVMPALPRVVLPRWLSVAGADEDAPDIGLVSSPTLQPGVYRRVVAGTLQMYICLGSVEHFIQEVTHLPAGPYQPLAMQVAVLHEFPVNEVVVSNGTRPLWSDDVVICPFHDELRVLVTVSSAGVGERPTELPTQPPQIIPGGGGHRASDANSTSTSCAAASHIMVSGDEVTSKRRRRDWNDFDGFVPQLRFHFCGQVARSLTLIRSGQNSEEPENQVARPSVFLCVCFFFFSVAIPRSTCRWGDLYGWSSGWPDLRLTLVTQEQSSIWWQAWYYPSDCLCTAVPPSLVGDILLGTYFSLRAWKHVLIDDVLI